MAGNKTAIKNRIKSINATKKITGAMKLVATVKLQRSRNQMEKNRIYADAIKETVGKMLSGEIDVESIYLKKKDAPLKIHIVFCSDMGLCGGYSINLLKLILDKIDKKDCIVLIGLKLYDKLKEYGYNIINDPISSEEVDYLSLKKKVDSILDDYKDNKYNSINVVYTKLLNSVKFEPVVEEVIPCKLERQEKLNKEVLFEPSAEEILEDLIPMMVESQIYARYLEAKTAEYGARRFAMENATDNANELTDELLLAYNQARQAAITQEITEIVAGSDAL